MTGAKKFIFQFLWSRMKMVFCGRLSVSSGILKTLDEILKNIHEVVNYVLGNKNKLISQGK